MLYQARSRRIDNWLLGIALVLVAVLFVRSCDQTPPALVTVPAVPFTVYDATPTVTTTTTGDSVVIARLQHEVDSLRAAIRRAGGRTTFRTDTLLQIAQPAGIYQLAPDSIQILCDETNRTITLNVRPAQRLLQVEAPRTDLVRAFVEAGTFYDLTTIEPRAAIGTMIALSDRLSLVLAAEARLPATLQLRAGINAGLRWTF